MSAIPDRVGCCRQARPPHLTLTEPTEPGLLPSHQQGTESEDFPKSPQLGGGRAHTSQGDLRSPAPGRVSFSLTPRPSTLRGLHSGTKHLFHTLGST